MPIRPENRARYPKDWKQVRARIMERAENRCECRGECGHEHEDRGTTDHLRTKHEPPRCDAPNARVIVRDMKARARFVTAEDVADGHILEHDDTYEADGVRVVLTIGHLDHTPENNDPANLRAWCQFCHLNYDKHEHVKNARRTRFTAKACRELF